MEKKFYLDPEMEVVELKLNNAILTGSDGKPAAKDEEEGDETDF